jgi:hypothetical protein
VDVFIKFSLKGDMFLCKEDFLLLERLFFVIKDLSCNILSHL